MFFGWRQARWRPWESHVSGGFVRSRSAWQEMGVSNTVQLWRMQPQRESSPALSNQLWTAAFVLRTQRPETPEKRLFKKLLSSLNQIVPRGVLWIRSGGLLLLKEILDSYIPTHYDKIGHLDLLNHPTFRMDGMTASDNYDKGNYHLACLPNNVEV